MNILEQAKDEEFVKEQFVKGRILDDTKDYGRTQFVDEIYKLQQENQQLKADLEMYENGVYFSNENDKLQEENQQLKNLYVRTCNHLFNIGNDELARYFQAQIGECNVFTPQEVRDKECSI